MTIIERLPDDNPPRAGELTPRVLGIMFVGLIVAFAVIGLLSPMPIKMYFLITAGALTPWFLLFCFYFARDYRRRQRYLRGQ